MTLNNSTNSSVLNAKEINFSNILNTPSSYESVALCLKAVYKSPLAQGPIEIFHSYILNLA